MSVENTNIGGISRRRQNRWASKKRKVEAFLNLVTDEKSKILKSESPTESTDQMMQQVRQMSASVRREKEEIPSFYLTEDGFKAQVDFKFYNKDKPLGQTIAPLFIEDLQQLLLKVMVGGSAASSLRWAKLGSAKKVSHVVLFMIDGVSKDEIVRNISRFQNTLDIFSDMVEIVAPISYRLNFATALCSVHLTLGYYPQAEEQNDGIGTCTSHISLSSIVHCPRSDEIANSSESSTKDFSKLHLLLNPLQLALENFPLPLSVLQVGGTKDYCFTKSAYEPVTAKSPMFALDCEMCRMKSGRMEVTKIAVVDEELNAVYETLVKPKGHVSDYLTKYSGVDKEMLQPVKTTLTDVQEHLQTMLPPDAILCGQSLNFDLHALKMIHPYIIDTSVIFNTSGRRTKKSSLRVLSEVFLKLGIQGGEKGHDPIEDCIAAMKLVQLKLKNGPAFGDAILASCVKSIKVKPTNRTDKVDDIKLNVEHQQKNKSATTEEKELLPETPLSVRFFPKLQTGGKNVCIVSDMVSYSQYPSEMLSESILRVNEPNMRKTVKKSVELMHQYYLTVCHINPITSEKNENSIFSNIDKYIQKLFVACANKSLFIVAVTGAVKCEGDYENALCMIKLKTEK